MAGRVKIKQLKKVVGDVNISSMFEEMMGAKDADPDIIIPKFVFVRNTLRNIYRIFHQFSDMLGKDFPEYTDHFNEIRKFADDMKESVYFTSDTDEKEESYKSVSHEEINLLYRKLKENSYVKTLIILCSKLRRYESAFSDQDQLKENFVNQEPGLSFILFDFSKLDLKIMWANSRMKSSIKRYILMVLASIYKRTHAMYKCVTSPDVDVEKFTQMLINSISELKRQPQLHRCQHAFKRIEQSVELLREKFDDYYRESVASENADMLVMNFIVDVSNQGGANATLTQEFRRIIKYMGEVSQKTGKNKDPNVQKIFKMLNTNFNLMEKSTNKNKTDDKNVDDSDIMPTEELKDVELNNPDLDPELDAAAEKQARRIEKQRAKKKRKNKKSVASQTASGAVDDSTNVPDDSTNELHSDLPDDFTNVPSDLPDDSTIMPNELPSDLTDEPEDNAI